MEVKWTREQEEAVFAPVSNILVTAAAGAGKTQVLTGRILNRILGGADVSRMLIVTFTNAAAAEMKSRIAKALSEELIKNPQNEHVMKQALLLPLASIQTIHAFCLDVIKNNFFRAGISPDFKIADEAECKIMKAEAIEEAFDALYEEGDSDFLAFSDSFSNTKNDDKAAEMVLNLYTFAESMPFPEKWLLKQCEMYENVNDENFEDFYFIRTILENVKETLTECMWRIEDAKEQCEKADGLQAYCEMFKNDAEKIKELINFKSWNELSEAAFKFSFDRKKSVRGGDEDVKNAADQTRSEVKDEVLKALLYVAHSREENIAMLLKTAPVLKGLVKCTLKFSEIFSAMKKEKNLVDFGDIEHICINLLSNEDIAKERRGYFEEIYVDEYQDSNSAQDYIFRAVSREADGTPNVFMVGDIKQSIYGFRQTSPQLFLDKKETYKFGDSKNRKIVLSKNFRSSRGIIDYINSVFESIMCRSVGGVEYDDEERLVYGASYPENTKSAEIDVINMGDKSGEEGLRAEALFVAEKIISLMKREKVYDAKNGVGREMKFSDIAVIMRSPRSSVGVFEEVFRSYNIPTFVDFDDGYFESSETRVMLSLLTIVDNPENDIPLISVLRSPIGGFDEDDLARIKLFGRDKSFYGSLCACGEGEGGLSKRCSEFIKMLKKFRMYAKYMPCHRLIDTLLSETGYFDAVCAMPGAGERIENLNLLTEQARNYENTSYRGLYNFINYINNVKEKSGNLGASKSVGEGHSVVKIMSIHKSKGLEFPVVFLSRCAQKMNVRDLSGDLILHSDCGIGISYADCEKRIFSDTALKTASKIKKRQEELSEEIRVLYVALTRAKEKLILTGAVKNADKAMGKWKGLARLAERGFPIKENSYMDYLMAAYLCRNDFCSVNILEPQEYETDEIYEEKQTVFAKESDEEIKKLLEFEYPHGNLWEIPSKVTVTELKRMKETAIFEDSTPLYPDVNIKVPGFMEKEKITPAAAGKLMHFVMQNIGLDVNGREDVEKFVENLVLNNILSREEANAVDCGKIAAFFESDIGVRLKKADKVFREEPFAMAVDASLVTGRREDFGQKIMVQGIIDCYFFEGDNIVLLDYKTDKNTSRENIINNYEKQIEIYAEALEKKYFKKIYEKFIYLFNNSGIIRIE